MHRFAGLVSAVHVFKAEHRAKTWMPGSSPGMTVERSRPITKPYTGKPFAFANSFNDASGRAPMCWITSAAASAPSRPAFS